MELCHFHAANILELNPNKQIVLVNFLKICLEEETKIKKINTLNYFQLINQITCQQCTFSAVICDNVSGQPVVKNSDFSCVYS